MQGGREEVGCSRRRRREAIIQGDSIKTPRRL